MEALNWIKNNKNKYCFASNHFEDRKSILYFVKKLYKLGALKVEVDNIMDEPDRIEDEGGPYADTLLVTLPKNKAKRLDLQAAIFDTRPDELSSNIGSIASIDWNKHDMVVLWWD